MGCGDTRKGRAHRLQLRRAMVGLGRSGTARRRGTCMMARYAGPVALVLALALGGCGGDDDDSSTGSGAEQFGNANTTNAGGVGTSSSAGSGGTTAVIGTG